MALVSRRALTGPTMPDDRSLIERFDIDRVEIGALFAVAEGPWGVVAEVLSGAWPTPSVRVWVDYGSHVECHIIAAAGDIAGSPRMILRNRPGV